MACRVKKLFKVREVSEIVLTFLRTFSCLKIGQNLGDNPFALLVAYFIAQLINRIKGATCQKTHTLPFHSSNNPSSTQRTLRGPQAQFQ